MYVLWNVIHDVFNCDDDIWAMYLLGKYVFFIITDVIVSCFNLINVFLEIRWRIVVIWRIVMMIVLTMLMMCMFVCIHFLWRWLLWRWCSLYWQSDDVALFGKVTWVMHYVCVCMMFHLEVIFICISMTMAWKLWQTRRSLVWQSDVGLRPDMPYLALFCDVWYHMHISEVVSHLHYVKMWCYLQLYRMMIFIMLFCDDVGYGVYGNNVTMQYEVVVPCLWWWIWWWCMNMNKIISEIMKYDFSAYNFTRSLLYFRLDCLISHPLLLLVHCLYIDNVQITRSSLLWRLDEEYLVV